MKSGLDITFRFLAKTENRAAADILAATIKSNDTDLRRHTVESLLLRRETDGHMLVLKNLSRLSEEELRAAMKRPERLVRAITSMLSTKNPKAIKAACAFAKQLSLYDVIPVFCTALGKAPDATSKRELADAVVELTERYYQAVGKGCDSVMKRKDRDGLRSRIISGLEQSVKEVAKHRCNHIVEAYLILVKFDNASFRQSLYRSEEDLAKEIIHQMSTSTRGGVLRLLLSFMDDPRLPKDVSTALSSRVDARFLEYLFHSIIDRPGKNLSDTLIQFGHLAWAKPGHDVLDILDGKAQSGAITMLMLSAVDKDKKLDFIEWMLEEGKPEGRQAAAGALKKMDNTADVNELILKHLHDNDPLVKAPLITEVRPRGIMGAMRILISLVSDDMDDITNEALKEAMPEFTFRSYLSRFETLDNSIQQMVGNLVYRLDKDMTKELRNEMTVQSPVRRRRAVAAAAKVGAVAELEPVVITLLNDDDHTVRIAAAESLAAAKSVPSWNALCEAMFDRSVIVREAAERSIEMLGHSIREEMEKQQKETAGKGTF